MAWAQPELEVGSGLGMNPPGPEEPEEVGAEELEAEEGEPAEPAEPAGPDGWTREPAAGELLPGAAVRASWAAPGSATAAAPAVTTLARTAVVVTEPTRARPSSRAATRWRSSFMRELWFTFDTQGEPRRAS